MNKVALNIDGAYLLQQTRHEDERGYFSRSYCKSTMQSQSLATTVIQQSESYNKKPFTLRGMHFQSAPYEEVKLIRCLQGKLYDVILDLRPDSPTYLQHYATELSAFDGQMIYVPKGVAHGFMTLQKNTVIGYSMLEGEYSAEHASGVRWNDSAFNIAWPEYSNIVISERDRSYKDYIE
ncbi:dTDP-4-dehydrorhamnose 3,5-epimerase family protein [Aestuariibacter sp. AA17]|uniref:dTDP-4-dehydrorhamnose 3,5-epimerase n=1 Tax=Fluctibacter corallii TaxID=2984329 RepID=A0ABT3A9X9_9ALTE|nr:dTDP-4-dehydrorhamnose 3,5-epimerase family protein [Aestuariibacter sp. AA17]MCV2885433.1 dTDP-4-dehydrorhamnose 3,5-epimerase family protein [Aestuariibacter sp. AA17]